MSKKWLSLVFFLLVSLPAYALELAEFGTVNLAFPSLSNYSDPSMGASPALGLGGGATLGLEFLPNYWLESGVIFVTRNFTRGGGTNPTAFFNMTVAQVPLLIRYSLSRSVSFGGGMYISSGVGNVNINQASGNTTLGYQDVGLNRIELGLTLSFRYRAHLNEVMKLIVDERFLISTSNQDTSGTGSLSPREFQSWVGVLFDI